MERKVFVHTFGCQMNEADSSRMIESLAKSGYAQTQQADDADLILLNTCAIREKSEQKLLSALGRYRPMKLARGARIGVGGCVAQQEKDRLLKKVPYLDFVFGPDQVGNLPEILDRVESENVRLAETAWLDSSTYVFPRADAEFARGKTTAFVSAMKGCNNVCSFCVVPYTRGREVSRGVDDLLGEVADLAAVGVREITLIGQNVNSYEGGVSFAELLRRTANVPGVERVRFTTSHPHDLSDELIALFAEEPKVMPHFHLPVQSGSEPVLKRMRRDYTIAWYLDRLERLRAARPGIAITTDIIVGFLGETDEDFERTMELVEKVRYENAFSFIFSPRPHTTAIRHLHDWGEIPKEVATARLVRLQALLREHSWSYYSACVGSEVEVLVEGPSRYDPEKRFGRTPENRVVNFEGTAETGSLVRVRIEDATPNALSGVQVGFESPRAVKAPVRLAVVG
ncbi:tRNA (N6-isopentenyl adenosine(37)-C2)-methylthiotransferase MiaB [Vulgatibacter incomptus]|uniref:tRNA-2-methylthio-N(6)-dimethylallyladenosine synthase n=1 Tax=Vulgatibacter incomptus TaxID=1391653 RepID=A0A0K1PCI6_9BACT|nr:tRNA (N6-isopentenyl adenosine(37)-C2)-methylthiotransferase MiaB [Vulgatibacter incomptus]AKU90834.1 tRNA-i(6)A37 methylthiotransferase [Vulgatibacter incomptus]